MSLWMLLLIVLLTVTAVVFFSFSMSATDPRAKRRYRIIATIALMMGTAGVHEKHGFA